MIVFDSLAEREFLLKEVKMSIREDLRNIAIIAHVDHGKTTLVDGMLQQAQVFRDNQQVDERVMDSNDLERERGITILSKNTAIQINHSVTKQNVKINIIDTPGHADFGGEVERVLNMVDGVLLLVDAAEGPRPQTRFVLKKALELGLKAIVVINKVDRKDADSERVMNEVFDLFIELGATDEQAEYHVVYAIATHHKAGLTPDVSENLTPLFDSIIDNISPPDVDEKAPFQFLVTNLDYDKYRGVTAIGRIFAGKVKKGENVFRMKIDGTNVPENIRYLYVQEGLKRVEVESASAGDIVAISGLEGIDIGETLADFENPIALPAITVEHPTVRMAFSVNTSPFTGLEGKWGTSRRLRERLYNEVKSNVAMRISDTDNADTFIVSGRGELHLAILIETMRREGYEFQVSSPEVILKYDDDGKKLEPFEELHVETDQESLGTVVEMLGKRKGKMENMLDMPSGRVEVTYIIPTRGLLGFRYQFLTATRGMGIMNALFHGYKPWAGEIRRRSKGSLIAFEKGTASTFGLKNAEERGLLFIPPNTEVYAGMVVGENKRPGDIEVNVAKSKHLTNMRKSVRDIVVRLAPPKQMSLDESIEYINDDELLEVTPLNLRIRKRVLDHRKRGREVKKSKDNK
jgi:GTP-binding protein